MGASWAVLIAETFYVVAQLGQRGRCGGTCQAAADDDHFVLPLVCRVDEFEVEAVLVPFFAHRTGRDCGVELERNFFLGNFFRRRLGGFLRRRFFCGLGLARGSAVAGAAPLAAATAYHKQRMAMVTF